MAERGPARKAYEELIRQHVSPWMKARGFARSGSAFAKWVDKNCDVVVFRILLRGMTTSSHLVFDVDYGILSSRVYYFETGLLRPKKAPLWEDLQWRDSICPVEPRTDCLWVVDSDAQAVLRAGGWPSRYEEVHPTTGIATLGQRLCDAIEKETFPVFERFTSDRALADFWLGGRCQGISEFERLRNLSILLLSLGPGIELDAVLARLRENKAGAPAPLVARHLERIEVLRRSHPPPG